MIDDIIEKVKKLLALSESSNINEATSAAQKAADLMMKYQIDIASLEDVVEKEEVSTYTLEKSNGKNKKTYKGVLAAGIADYFGCKVFWRNSDLEFIGRKSDLQATNYLYRAVLNQINELCEKLWIKVGFHTGQHGKSWKNSFYLGITEEIQKKLKERKQSARTEFTQNNSRALVVINELEYQVAAVEYRLNLRKSPPARLSSHSGYSVGKQAANNINLGSNKQLSGSFGNISNSGLSLGFKK